MPASVKQLRDNQNNFIYPKIAKEGLVEPINGNDVGISAINGIQSSTVQGALNELAGNNVEIVKTASGSVISVSDSADYRLLGLKLYGKSVQDGVPTPEAPVEIESAGNTGSITLTIANQNLAKSVSYTPATANYGTLVYVNAVSIMPKVGQTYTLSVDLEAESSTKAYWNRYLGFPSDLPFAVNPGKARYSCTITFTKEFQNNIALTKSSTSDGVTITPSNFMLTPASVTDVQFVESQSQTLTYLTPNGLPGIPVESGGNYTDAEGQQWICDEVDFGRGKYVQRVKKEELTGTPNFNVTADIDAERFRWGSCLTNIYKDGSNLSLSNFATFQRWSTGTSNHPIFAVSEKDVYFKPTASISKEEVNRLFSQMIASENPPYILGQLQTPIETILSPDKISVYTTLTSYKPCTTITTDSDPAAGIEVKYLTDSGVAEVLGYYASKDDLADKQDKLTGTTGQFVGFDAEGEAEAQKITAEDVGAMPTVGGGTTGQYLRKTADGQAWQDGPDLSGYATQSWVNGRGYLTAIPAEYVTDSELTSKGYATTADVAETYAKKALKFTGTFTAAGWTSATGGYSQTINVSGLTADDEPVIDLNSTATDADTFNGQLEAFGLVSNFTTGAGTLTAVVLGDSAPTVDIPIHGMVVY